MSTQNPQATSTECPYPCESSSDNTGMFIAIGVILTLPVICMFVSYYCVLCYRRHRLIVADSEKWSQMTQRHPHCTLLPRSDRLSSRIRKLCTKRNKHLGRLLLVPNVAVVTNDALRQRYEQAYQTSRRSVQPANATTSLATNVPCTSKKLRTSSTRSAAATNALTPGILRPGETYMFYSANETEISDVLTAFYSLNEDTGRLQIQETSSEPLELSKTFSYKDPSVRTDFEYVFVMRVTLGPDKDSTNQTQKFTKINITDVLPEFLISWCVVELPEICESGGGGGGGGGGGDVGGVGGGCGDGGCGC